MSAHATIRTGYRARLLIVSLAFIGIGLWFLYDGAIAWPQKQRMQQTYKRLQEEHPRTWREQWREVAWQNKEAGWPQQPTPEITQSTISDFDITLQWIIACIMLPVGVAAGVIYLRLGGRWIKTDAQGVQTSWGQHAKWDDILWVDKSRWRKKGIAVVRYKDGQSHERITLDDWKYYREPTAQMLNEIEMHLPEDRVDQIDAGPGGGGDQASAAGDQVKQRTAQ